MKMNRRNGTLILILIALIMSSMIGAWMLRADEGGGEFSKEKGELTEEEWTKLKKECMGKWKKLKGDKGDWCRARSKVRKEQGK